jgi:hypothetical protein
MLLRFRGPDGMVRITVEPADTFARLGEKVCFLNFLEEHVPVLTIDSCQKCCPPRSISRPLLCRISQPVEKSSC